MGCLRRTSSGIFFGGIETELIFADEWLIPNEEAIARVDGAISSETDLVLGIGSGVINDLCKYGSFCRELPYDAQAASRFHYIYRQKYTR